MRPAYPIRAGATAPPETVASDRPHPASSPTADPGGAAQTHAGDDAILRTATALLSVFAGMAADLKRIADKLDPPPPAIVDTVYVAKRLGCTTTWIAQQIRDGSIPSSCVVVGTGNGKPWKFHRDRIDRWIEAR